MEASGLSSYLHQLSPHKYGSQQEDYLARAEAAINEAVSTIRAGRSSETPLTEVFSTVKDRFWAIRHQIAVDHSTNNAELFGTYRASKEAPPTELGYVTPLTALDFPYREYNEIFMKQLQEVMDPMKRTLRTFEQREIRTEETALGRKCAFSVSVLEGRELSDLKLIYYPSDDEIHSVLDTEKSAEEVKTDFDLMKELKAKGPKLYERFSMPANLGHLITTYPSPKTFPDGSYEGNLDHLKNLFAMCTLRLEIDGKLYALSRYLTWLYQDYQTDPVERMAKRSIGIIVHQDPFLIEATLQEIAKVFEKAILWDRATDSLQELKNRVALLRFLYAHCMPCVRGDGAVGDWLELAIYRYHGFIHTHHNSSTLPCFEPLASLRLSHYLGRYDRTITVTE